MSHSDFQFDEVQELLDQFSLDGLTAEQAARLEQLAMADPSVCERYVRWAFIHAGLRTCASLPGVEDCGGVLGSDGLFGLGDAAAPQGDEVELLTRPEQSVPIPGFIGNLHHALGYLSQTGPFSYLVSAVLMCVAALAAWQYKIADMRDLAGRMADSSAARPLNDRGAEARNNEKPPMAGRITDTAECKWGDHRMPLVDADYVVVGRQIQLDSGLLEITFFSGAKVILQGPVVFDVDTCGGFLRYGRLTGKLERLAVSGGNRFQIPNSFIVRTPTAVVTDLGTEFGVEVDSQGGTTSHVFRGAVKIYPVTDVMNKESAETESPEKQSVVLKENDSARVEAGADRVSRVGSADVPGDRFVRSVRGRRVAIRLFNTGEGIAEQKPDPNWQIVAASNDPDFKPRQAIVSTAPSWWLSNDTGRSRWIALTPRYQQLIAKNDTTYTFRTTFEFGKNAMPDTAVLKGWFVVDNRVLAIRLNGQKTEVPEHAWDDAKFFHSFMFDRGFVAGKNTLEIDVENIDPITHYVTSPMGLRVDLEGSVRENAAK